MKTKLKTSMALLAPVGVMRRWGRDFSFGDGPGGLRESLYGKHQPFIGAYFPDRAFAEQYATCISGTCGFHGRPSGRFAYYRYKPS